MFRVEREDGQLMGEWDRFTDAMKWLIAKAAEYEAAWWYPANADVLIFLKAGNLYYNLTQR